MGSCNGILCLSAVDVYPLGHGGSNIPRNPIYIMNPITQGYQQLPELPTLHCNKVLSGFGFDFARNEFKVVLVLFHKGTSTTTLRNQVVIHTLGNSTWRSGTSHAPEFLFEAFEVNSPAFINGCLHWITMDRKKDIARSPSSSKLLIVAFRVGLETFKMVSTPDTLGKLNTELECPLKQYGLAVLEGCLSLVDFSSENFVHIWLMKNINGSESWKLSEEIFGKFASFQYLAYLFELWKYYEEEFGNLSTLYPDSYRIVTDSTSNRGKSKRRKPIR
ncbi:F-box protein [Thalictrum thalictroides]|uniref:F-box protein n=1 Tax=Thalictrum thalictroides TaxID=46969 RepID=A0A7J6W2H5_THATH|nr:F-box protein [Thalictrum thalictroides]